MRPMCVLIAALFLCVSEVRVSGGEEAQVAYDHPQAEFAGTAHLDFAGYARCPVLFNRNARVILGPHCGGRLLEYAWKGKNALYLDPKQDGLMPKPEQGEVQPCAGRFDVGPEHNFPAHPLLWTGAWTAKFTGPRRARMTSQVDAGLGLQLVRDVVLAAESSHLRITQTMTNVSDKPRVCCYWERTFAPSGGTCVVPLTLPSRFPGKYIMQMPGSKVWYNPKDPQIQITDRFALVKGRPQQAEIAFDSYEGWLAYHRDEMLFVKRFPADPKRAYSGPAPFTVCFYYTDTLVELEPMGPLEFLEPGASASFTVDWWYVPHKTQGPTDALEAEKAAKSLLPSQDRAEQEYGKKE